MSMIIICFLFANFKLFCINYSTPLSPENNQKSFFLGLNVAENIPLNPNYFINPPTYYTEKTQQSLDNGLNGLGFGTSLSLGACIGYYLNTDISFLIHVDYSKWKSINTLFYSNSKTINSENTLELFQIACSMRYYYNWNFYISPEISFNLLPVHVKENDIRGSIEFSKNYFRIGAGLSTGTLFPITNNLFIDLSVKAQLLNLLLQSTDKQNTPESEALIKSVNSTTEDLINLLTFKVACIYYL